MSRSPQPALETNDSVSLDSLVSSPYWAVDTWLWGLVAVAFLADVVLTHHGIGLGLQEGNPLARALFESLGVIETMVLLKGCGVAIGLCTWASVPRRYRAVVPLGLALPWLVASFVNLTLILQL